MGIGAVFAKPLPFDHGGNMAIGYLVLAIVLAGTLNAHAPWLRVGGTLVAALALCMMVLSIVLADVDGTFAAVPASASLIHRITPTILNVQAVIAAIAILFLAWSAWMQIRRPVVATLPLRNDTRQFGKASRAFHWMIAVLMFCLVPIGLFMAILPQSSPERAGFVGAHQALGLTVLVLVIGRIGWIIYSPPPSLKASTALERRAASAGHICLYALLVAFPISGFLIRQEAGLDIYGWTIAPIAWPGAAASALSIHSWALPALLYAMLGLHLGAVLKHHFGDRDRSAVRRMLR